MLHTITQPHMKGNHTYTHTHRLSSCEHNIKSDSLSHLHRRIAGTEQNEYTDARHMNRKKKKQNQNIIQVAD